MAKKKKSNLKKGTWTKDEIKQLRKEFPRKSCEEVANNLKRPFYAVKRKAYRLGLKKTKKYLKSIGRA